MYTTSYTYPRDVDDDSDDDDDDDDESGSFGPETTRRRGKVIKPTRHPLGRSVCATE